MFVIGVYYMEFCGTSDQRISLLSSNSFCDPILVKFEMLFSNISYCPEDFYFPCFSAKKPFPRSCSPSSPDVAATDGTVNVTGRVNVNVRHATLATQPASQKERKKSWFLGKIEIERRPVSAVWLRRRDFSFECGWLGPRRRVSRREVCPPGSRPWGGNPESRY